MRRWRLLWAALALILALAAGLPLGVYGLLASESGTRWLLQKATQLAQSPDFSLQLAEVNGSLLGHLELGGIRLHAAGTDIDVEKLSFRWMPTALMGRLLHVQELALTGVRVKPPPPSTEPPQAPSLPDLGLPLTVQLDRLQVEGLTVAQDGGDLVFEHLAFAARLDADAWAVRDLAVRGTGLDLAGTASLGPGAPHALDGQLSGTVDAPELGQVRATLALSGEALQPSFQLNVSAPIQLRATGSADLREVEPGFAVAANWPQADWPLQGTPQVQTSAGRLQIQGTVAAYRLQLAARLRGPDFPPLKLQLQGQGDSQGLQLEPLVLNGLSGSVTATGPVRWAPELSWDLALQADGLNPGEQFPEWGGELGGQIQAAGRIGAQGPEAQVQIARIDGTLRGQPIHASGGLDYRAAQLRAKALDIASGPNRVRLDGRADDRFDLNFELSAPALAALYPGLDGQLQGQGRLTGSPAAPALRATLNGRDLAYDTLRLGELQLQADWGDQGGRAVLHAAGLVDSELQIDVVDANLSGTPEAHTLALKAQSPDLALDLGARGGWQQAQWRGELQRLTLTEPVLGAWALQAPATLQLAADRVNSTQLCLQQGQTTTQLCLQGGWSAAAGLDASGRLNDLDLERFADTLPGEAVIQGRLNAEFQASGPPQNPQATLTLLPTDGQLQVPGELEGEPLTIPFRNARVTATFADDRGSAELKLQLGEGGQADGKVTLGARPQRALGGRLSANFPDLRLVEGFVPALESVKGHLQLDMNLAGTLDDPRPTGALQVLDASARLPAAGLELQDIALAVRGDGSGPLTLNGGVSSGEGRLNLAGTLNPDAAGGPAVDLTVTGKDFQAARLPEALVQISPDLRLTGQGPYHLSGTLDIPKAHIELKELPAGSVAVSDDEVVVGETPTQTQGGPHSLTAAVRVTLGDDVTFKGFGLTTGLTGTLNAGVNKKGTSLHGKIEMRDGIYDAYGQYLKVERGRLLFAGPPDSPDLDLRAVRESRDGEVKAYLAMSGPLAKPTPRVYSEPALPDAEALAYLLTGRGLEQTGDEESAEIADAALAFGLGKGEPLLQKLGSNLGLDDVRLEGGSNGVEGSSLLVGKYLNPDLYLGYSRSLFEPEGAVLLRLRLNDKLDLESRAGTEQSVDLIYRYEHD